MSISVSKLMTFTGHKDCVYTLEQSEDPAVFFFGGGRWNVAQWDLRGEDKGVLVAKLEASVYALHFYSPKNTLIIGQNYQGIHVIDVKSKKELASLHLTKAAIFDIKSHNEFLFVGTGDGEIVVVNIPNLTIIRRLKFSGQSVRCLAVNPQEGKLPQAIATIASGSLISRISV